MTWFALTGDERITKRCATENCGGQPTWRLEAGDVGSDYCSGCKAKIEARDEPWEVRAPLRYGSKHVKWLATEAYARAFAEKLATERYPGHGLQIHTRSRVVYIDHGDDV